MNETPFSLQTIYNQVLRKRNENYKKKVNSWHASRLGSCLCGVYLERMGSVPDEPFNEETLGIFSLGNTFEKEFVTALQEYLVLFPEQDEIKNYETQAGIGIPEYDVTGYIDLVVNKKDGTSLLYEFKSINERASDYMRKSKKGAQLSHRMQLWLYLKAKNLPEGRLIYRDRNFGKFTEYPVWLNDKELQENVEMELKILNEAWKTKTPPLPVTDPKDWRGKYCQFHLQCLKTIESNN